MTKALRRSPLLEEAAGQLPEMVLKLARKEWRGKKISVPKELSSYSLSGLFSELMTGCKHGKRKLVFTKEAMANMKRLGIYDVGGQKDPDFGKKVEQYSLYNFDALLKYAEARGSVRRKWLKSKETTRPAGST